MTEPVDEAQAGTQAAPCESCEHLQDDSCKRWEICAYCGNGFCYCDPIEETEEGPMHADCAKKCYGEAV